MSRSELRGVRSERGVLRQAQDERVEVRSEANADSDFARIWSDARAIAERERFLHWQVAFPGVWQGWQDASPKGGFDAVIGNPPWDRIKLQEVEWFSSRMPELALAPTAAARRAGIRKLRADGDPLVEDFDDAKERADRMGQIVRGSGHYPLLGGGDINLYSLFVERAMGLVKPDGLVGLLTPSGIYADKTAAKFFKSVSTTGACGVHTRLREPEDFLQRRSCIVQVLRVDFRRSGASVRRYGVRVLHARCRDRQGSGALLPTRARRLRAGEPEHRDRACVPHSTGRGDHARHLRAASGAGGPVGW